MLKLLSQNCELVMLIVFCSIGTVFSTATTLNLQLPQDTRQVLLVTTSAWNIHTGTLQLFARQQNEWLAVGSKIPVTVGRNGLGWGLGLHSNNQIRGIKKREGDGRAPAGIFRLGPAFGYHAQSPCTANKFPYRQATDRDYYVDDSMSADYNKWVTIAAHQPNNPKHFWKSCERMKRDDNLYEYGIVVHHNHNAVAGAGSAIFIHIWRRPGAPTSGCTAMSKSDLLTLLQWLDATCNPLLIQIPISKLANIRVE